MFLTVHAAAGILISQATREPVSAFFVSFISHYILDIIPHGDEGIGRWIHEKPIRLFLVGFADLIILASYVITILHLFPYTENLLIISGVFGGVLPDFISELHHQSTNHSAPIYSLTKIINKFHLVNSLLKKHHHLHHKLHFFIEKNISWRSGLIFQFAVFIFFFLLTLIV